MTRFLPAVLLCMASLAQAADTFTFSNDPGPHAVGRRVVQQYDGSRFFKPRVDLLTGAPTRGERARPMQALVWYPARQGGKRTAYRDYVATSFTEADFGRSAAEVAAAAELSIDGAEPARKAVLRREMTRPMGAVKDAAPAAGRFPVVVYAPSFGASAAENADLCEYLASQGYVVLAAPSMGPRSRAMTSDLEGLESQAGDIGWLIAHARTLPEADVDRVGVVGFSWGGLANVLAAAKDERIRALVSLDGSVRGYREYVDGGKDAARYVSAPRVAVPLLYVSRRTPSFEELNRKGVDSGFSFMNTMKYSDVYIVTMYPMQHMDFSSYAQRFAPDGAFGDYSRDEVSLAYSWTARYVHRFLDAYLKGDAGGLAFVNNTPAANRVPGHMLAVDIRRNGGNVAPTRENYVAALATEGFDKAIPLYDTFSKREGAFRLGPDDLYQWAVGLARSGKTREAMEIFRLATHLLPGEAAMFDGLAEMQARLGLREEALRNYRRVLELDPAHRDATRMVKQLGG